MITTTSTAGVTLVAAAELLTAHLANHQLPEPALLGVTVVWGHPQASVQLHSQSLADIAALLLIWAPTLSTITVEAWRVPRAERVQLSIASTLTSPSGEVVELGVYGDCAHDSSLIADLAPGEKRAVSLKDLHSWAAGGGRA